MSFHTDSSFSEESIGAASLTSLSSSTEELSEYWHQNYSPLAGSVAVSSLVAVLGVGILFGLMFKIRVILAATIGWLVVFIVAVGAYGMPIRSALMSTLYGAVYGAFKIGWVIVGALFFYDLSVHSGRFEHVKQAISNLSSNKPFLVIFIAYLFAAFMEGIAGFATPVALASVMLMQIGFDAHSASKFALIGNTIPVPFGALGLPITSVLPILNKNNNPDLTVSVIASAVVRLQLPLLLAYPWVLVWPAGGVKVWKQIWPALTAVSLTYTGTAFVLATFHGPMMINIASSLVTAIVLLVLLRFWKPPTDALMPAPKAGAGAPTEPKGKQHMRLQLQTQVPKHGRSAVVPLPQQSGRALPSDVPRTPRTPNQPQSARGVAKATAFLDRSSANPDAPVQVALMSWDESSHNFHADGTLSTRKFVLPSKQTGRPPPSELFAPLSAREKAQLERITRTLGTAAPIVNSATSTASPKTSRRSSMNAHAAHSVRDGAALEGPAPAPAAAPGNPTAFLNLSLPQQFATGAGGSESEPPARAGPAAAAPRRGSVAASRRGSLDRSRSFSKGEKETVNIVSRRGSLAVAPVTKPLDAAAAESRRDELERAVKLQEREQLQAIAQPTGPGRRASVVGARGSLVKSFSFMQSPRDRRNDLSGAPGTIHPHLDIAPDLAERIPASANVVTSMFPKTKEEDELFYQHAAHPDSQSTVRSMFPLSAEYEKATKRHFTLLQPYEPVAIDGSYLAYIDHPGDVHRIHRSNSFLAMRKTEDEHSMKSLRSAPGKASEERQAVNVAKARRGSIAEVNMAMHKKRRAVARIGISAMADRLRSFLPWVLLPVMVFVWGLDVVQKGLDVATVHIDVPFVNDYIVQNASDVAAVKIHVPFVNGYMVQMPPVVKKQAALHVYFSFNFLSNVGCCLTLASFISAPVFGLSILETLVVLLGTVKRMTMPLLTITVLMALALLFSHCGQDSTLGLLLAGTGVMFPLFSPMIGWLGVAVTGSCTSANLLFANLQVVAAQQIGLNPLLTVAANGAGGVVGNMLSAKSIAVAMVATGRIHEKSQAPILRAVLPLSLASVFLFGIWTIIVAYCFPSLIPAVTI